MKTGIILLVLLVPGVLHAHKAVDCDFDGSGEVDFPDFLLFAQSFGKGQGDAAFDPRYDLNDSGKIDFPDFIAFAQNFGHLNVALPGGVTMPFAYIQPGTFLMGSPESEPGRFSHEGPQHQVTIGHGFYLGKYEVTQGQWEAVMGTTPWSGQRYVQTNPDHPAVWVSWYDVQEFIHKLNEAAEASRYRLPTEAEWEYACRAGTTTRWSFGDDESRLGDYAWYKANASNVGEEYAHSVGTKLPNPWGLHDMHGNVYEWCQDWYGSYSSGPQAGSPEPNRALRGGCFVYSPRAVRSAFRDFGGPSYHLDAGGFRLLRQADGQSAQAHVIAGQVTESGGGVADVTLTLSGDVTATAFTGGDGSYTFWGLPDGAYTVTPARTGYTFVPDNLKVTVSGADVAGQHFTGTHVTPSVPDTLTARLPGGAMMPFVYIQPGTFAMGSPDTEWGRDSNEGPQHQVTINQGFYLGKYEVTQGQWEAVMGTTPWLGAPYVEPNPNHPAVYVSWNDAQAFIQKLNAAARDSLYRLPAEAEWEYACRAGTTTSWSFGDDASKLKDYAWLGLALVGGEGYAHQVGSELPNLWGLFDMHGNVWEWCQDGRRVYSNEVQVDPLGPVSDVNPAARGGAFNSDARITRSAFRNAYWQGLQFEGIGFRLFRRVP